MNFEVYQGHPTAVNLSRVSHGLLSFGLRGIAVSACLFLAVGLFAVFDLRLLTRLFVRITLGLLVMSCAGLLLSAWTSAMISLLCFIRYSLLQLMVCVAWFGFLLGGILTFEDVYRTFAIILLIFTVMALAIYGASKAPSELEIAVVNLKTEGQRRAAAQWSEEKRAPQPGRRDSPKRNFTL